LRLGGSAIPCLRAVRRSPLDEGQLQLLLSPFRELPVTSEVAQVAGRLLRKSGIRTADALIAATALIHALGLVTRNKRDFENVARLRVRERI